MERYEVYYRLAPLDDSGINQLETYKRTRKLKQAERFYEEAVEFASHQPDCEDGYRIDEVGIYDEDNEEVIKRTYI